MRESGGWGENVTDEEIITAMKLLAETEGIFAETAGGVTLGSTIKLLETGRISRDESIVICVTGNGLKTQEALTGKINQPIIINARLQEFDDLVKAAGKEYAVKA